MTEEGTPRPFHERFDINLGSEQVKGRFIVRIEEFVLRDYLEAELQSLDYGKNSKETVSKQTAYILGEQYIIGSGPESYIRDDFLRCLRVTEAVYKTLEGTPLQAELSNRITKVVKDSEVDLGIRWQPPKFRRTGAQLLDERLVNESLHWLSEPKYESVRKPFEKGLSHYYLEATNNPDRLPDVITDTYEAVEALAKVVNENNRELSRNRESFIKNIGASDYYKKLLKDYIEYGSKFRHAARLNEPKPSLSEPEVESFIYLTGLFIRLAIRTTETTS